MLAFDDARRWRAGRRGSMEIPTETATPTGEIAQDRNRSPPGKIANFSRRASTRKVPSPAKEFRPDRDRLAGARSSCRRGPITRWSYLVALLRVLGRYRPPRLAVEIDGVEDREAYGLVLISNIVHYAGVLHLARYRRLDDGRFEVYLFGDARRRALAGSNPDSYPA